MKKKFIYTLLLTTALSLSACGKKEETLPEIQPEDSAQTETETKNEQETPTETEVNTTADNTAENTVSSEESSVQEENVSIQITMEESSNEIKAEDGCLIATSTCSYPVVSIAENEAAAAAINADIKTYVDSFLADTMTEDSAQEMHEEIHNSTTEEEEEWHTAYSEDLSFTTARADENVISFRIASYGYWGGAHGNIASEGLNYDTHTGALIAFSDLSADENKFYADTLAYNRKTAASDGFVERLYTPEIADSEDMETVLYAPNKWYLKPAGLAFISDPYALGPYAAGTIEFIIPYQDLKEMGFLDSYDYHGRLILKLCNGASVQEDINGDGKKEELLFYTEANEATNYESIPHFYINGTDLLLDDANSSLKELLQNYAWNDYALYDMDSSDDTVELVFYSYEEDAQGEYQYYAHFYRYAKDGSLTSLGKTAEDVMNPLIQSITLEQ